MKNLIVGAGLTGLSIAHFLREAGEDFVIWEATDRAGGLLEDRPVHDDLPYENVHIHGPHVFHTKWRWIWDFVNSFTPFMPTTLMGVSKFHGAYYPIPVNLFTIHAIYNNRLLQDESAPLFDGSESAIETVLTYRWPRFSYDQPDPMADNFESVCRLRVGDLIYEACFEAYTERFWGRSAKEIPGFIARRIPVRLNYDYRYHSTEDIFVGIPEGGYNRLIAMMSARLPITYSAKPMLQDFSKWDRVFFTGDPLTLLGPKTMPYRGFSIEHDLRENYPFQQVINNTPGQVGREFCSRNLSIHKTDGGKTIVSRMIPFGYDLDGTHPNAAYPLPWHKEEFLRRTDELLREYPNLHLAGRRGTYSYLDMDAAIRQAANLVAKVI